MAHNFTQDDFEQEVLKSEMPVMVDFFAEWCGPCKMMGPAIEELAGEYKDSWKIGKLNIDENPDLAQKYGIQSIPTLLFFKGGEVVDKVIGFQTKDALKQKLV